MAKGIRKDYAKEFKLSVVYAMLSKTMKPKEIFELYKIDRQTAYRWVSEFKANGEKTFDTKPVVPSAEIKRLQKDRDDLQMENEILKKAIAYFGKKNTKE